MAEIEGGGGGKHKGKKPKGKKLSTRVDFTPMVDLGFLLITFFMLTTSMNKPQVMAINMPDKTPTEKPTVFPKGQVITLLLGENNRIFYYFGDGTDNPEIKYTSFSKDGVRKLLIDEARKRNPTIDSIEIYKKQFEANKLTEDKFKANRTRIKGNKQGLLVLIKAEDKAKYKNVVDILDEMLICNIGIYAIVDISPAEVEMINNVAPPTK